MLLAASSPRARGNVQAYAVHDSELGEYRSPFFAPDDREARRAFQGAVLQPGTVLHDYPHNFHLYHLGCFDVYTGDLMHVEHKLVVNAADLVLKKKEA